MQKNQAIRYGIGAGIATIGFYLLFYFIDKRLMFNPGIYWGSLALPLVAMVLACRQQARVQGGRLSWKEGIQIAFVVYVVAMAIYYLFYYVLFAYLDPGLVSVQAEVMQAGMERAKAILGERQAGAWEELDPEDLRVTPAKSFFAFSQSLIGGFLLSLLVGGLSKR